MTNIANLLKKYPDAKDMISRIVFMGGSKDENGMTEPYREFNFAYYPEAIQIVFDSISNCFLFYFLFSSSEALYIERNNPLPYCLRML